MASDRNLINAFDDCVQRLESGETLDDILKDYPESADYLRDLLMISQMVYQVRDEDDTHDAQSRGRARLQEALKEKPKRIQPSRLRSYGPFAAVATLVIIMGLGLLLTSELTSANATANFASTTTAIVQMNSTTEALINATQVAAFSATQSSLDPFELTATSLVSDITATAASEITATMEAIGNQGSLDSFELTATQLIAELTSTADVFMNQTIEAQSTSDPFELQATIVPPSQLDPFEMTATQIIQNATAMASGLLATPTPFVENFDVTATALLMPTITLVGTPIPSTMAPVIPTSVASLPQSTAEPNISAVEAAQVTATALADLFNQLSPTPVGSGNELPNTGGGNGVEGAIKTTSMPPSPTSEATGTSTATPTPAPSMTAIPTQVANAEVLLTEPSQNNVQATALPALIPLSAGEIDDNADWDRYLLYRREFLSRGFQVYDLDVTGRQIISVVDENGLSVLGAKVRIFVNGEVVAEALTYATGQTMFFPNLDERTRGVNEFFVTVEKGGVSEQFMLNRDEATSWSVTLPLTINRNAVQLDVLFLIDTTSSMADEISQLQNNILHISDQVNNFADNIDVRYGLVLYREFDNFEYVTRRHEFTGDVSEFQTNLNAAQANSGDNNPDWDETLNVALDESLQRMSWRGEDTIKLIFLVADARPHINHPLEPVTYDQSIQDALARGIKIHPIASSGLEPAGEYIFRQIAQVTMGHFLFLTYETGVPGTPGDIRPELNVGEPDTTDPDDGYTVDRLADLVLRLIQDEINTYRGILRP